MYQSTSTANVEQQWLSVNWVNALFYAYGYYLADRKLTREEAVVFTMTGWASAEHKKRAA